MKKAATFLFLLLSPLLASCLPHPNYVSSDKSQPWATVIMPVFYEEAAPYEGVFGRKGVHVKKYFVSTVFQNRGTGEKMITGQMAGNRYTVNAGYMVSFFAPGRYDLVSFTLAGMPKDYDQGKCGRIGFDVASGETIILKGVKPAAITTQGLFKSRSVSLISFETLPKAFMATIKADHPRLELGKVRVIAPTSDNPAAFHKCIDETTPRFATLMDEKGTQSTSR